MPVTKIKKAQPKSRQVRVMNKLVDVPENTWRWLSKEAELNASSIRSRVIVHLIAAYNDAVAKGEPATK